MKKVIAICIIICYTVLSRNWGGNAFAQDIHFSQFYNSPLTQNPAFAGALYDQEAQINYKEQWKSIGSPYKTIAASYDLSFQKQKKSKSFFAAGINFYSDKAGDSKMGTTQVNLTGAAHVYINRFNKLGGGLQIGFAQRSVNYSALQFGNQYDGSEYNAALSSRETIGSSAISYPDVAAGVVWTYDNTTGLRRVVANNEFKTNVGLAVYHISRPKYSFTGGSDQLDVKFVLHGNTLISIPYSILAFVPGLSIYKQGTSTEIYAGSLIRFKLNQKSKYSRAVVSSTFAIGAYYRAKDAAVVAMQIEFSNCTIGMSYDINTSPLNTATVYRGGFEMSLRYVLANPFMAQSRSRF
jgi:type IX secretion system PorP/SprF family membrane protein